MSTNATPTAPITEHFRDRLRSRRAARRADLALRRDLAQYTSASDIRELEAILDRHEAVAGGQGDTGTETIRMFLRERRAS